MSTLSPSLPHVTLPYACDDKGDNAHVRVTSVRGMSRARQRVLDELHGGARHQPRCQQQQQHRQQAGDDSDMARALTASCDAQVTAYAQWRSYCRAVHTLAAKDKNTTTMQQQEQRKRTRDAAATTTHDTHTARLFEHLLSQWVDVQAIVAAATTTTSDDHYADKQSSEDTHAARLRALLLQQLQHRGDVLMQRLQRMQTEWFVLQRAVDDVNAVRCHEQRAFAAHLRSLATSRQRTAAKVSALEAVLRRLDTDAAVKRRAAASSSSSLLARLDDA